MKIAPRAALLLSILAFGSASADDRPLDRAEHMPAAPYLLAGAPTFDMTIAQFQ